jgi:YD repeat-containing protein
VWGSLISSAGITKLQCGDFHSLHWIIKSVQVGAAPDPQTGGDTPMTHTFDYDANGNLEFYTDPYGYRTTYEYDGYDRLRSVRDPLDNQTVIERIQLPQQNKQVIQNLDSSSMVLREATRISDPAGRLSSYKVALPNFDLTYEYQYQNGGKTVVVNDSMGGVTTVEKNGMGWLKKVTDAMGNEKEYVYEDETSTVKSGNVTRLIEREKDPDSGEFKVYTTTFTYNGHNKVATRVRQKRWRCLII